MSSNLTPGVYAIRQAAQHFLLVRPGAEHEYLFYQEMSAAEVAIWVAEGALELLPCPTDLYVSSSPPSPSQQRPRPQHPSYLRLEP